MLTSFRFRLLAAAVVWTYTMLLGGAAAAQPTDSVIAGSVVDQLGGVVVGAVVTVTDASGRANAVTTDSQGRFSIAVTAGRWRITASAPGFAETDREVQVPQDIGAPVALELAVAGQNAKVTVVVGRNYRVTQTSTATRSETPIQQLPQPVQVVTAQVIADQRPLILSDVLRNVSGISALRNSAEVFRTFNVRGFTSFDLSVDGLRNTYGLNDQPDAVAHLERLEVVKGPTAAQYGRAGLGGTVNLVTKSPLPQRATWMSLSTGSGGLIQPTIDVTGPLTSKGGVRGRAVVDFEQRDTPIEFVGVERWQLAPSVEFDLGRATTVLLKTDYRSRSGRRFVALPAYGTVTGLSDLRVPYDLFIGEPNAGLTENTGWQSTARLDHRFSAKWSLTTAVRWTANTFDMPSVGPNALQADRRTLTRRYSRFNETEQEAAWDGWMTGRFTTGALDHTIVVGGDASRFEYDSQFFSGRIGAIDISRPVYGQPITGVFLLDHTVDRIGGAGVYAQDQVTVTPRLRAQLALRYDRITKARRFVVANNRVAERTDGAVSPRIGVSFDVAAGAAVFGSYSEGLVGIADGTANQTGRPFRSQEGRQWEGGVKLDLADAVQVTVAGFELTRTGGVVPDPANATFSIQTGEQRSRGFEMDGNWQSSGGLSLLATYTFTAAEVTRDTSITIGNVLANVPRHAGRVWGKYVVPSRAISGLAVALGATFQGEQQGNIANTLTIPSSWVTDAGLFWERGRIGVQLNAVNLFDRRYALRGAFGNTGIIPGDTRRIVLTFKTSI